MKKRPIIVLGSILIAVFGASGFVTLSIRTQAASAVSDPRQELGLTRFGGHPEAFARGATDAQNTPTVFARVSPPDGGSGSCRT